MMVMILIMMFFYHANKEKYELEKQHGKIVNRYFPNHNKYKMVFAHKRLN